MQRNQRFYFKFKLIVELGKSDRSKWIFLSEIELVSTGNACNVESSWESGISTFRVIRLIVAMDGLSGIGCDPSPDVVNGNKDKTFVTLELYWQWLRAKFSRNCFVEAIILPNCNSVSFVSFRILCRFLRSTVSACFEVRLTCAAHFEKPRSYKFRESGFAQ